jgi:hypothetical protein
MNPTLDGMTAIDDFSTGPEAAADANSSGTGTGTLPGTSIVDQDDRLALVWRNRQDDTARGRVKPRRRRTRMKIYSSRKLAVVANGFEFDIAQTAARAHQWNSADPSTAQRKRRAPLGMTGH